MRVQNTFAVDENVSIESISEEDNVFLFFEVNIRPRKDVGGHARDVRRRTDVR